LVMGSWGQLARARVHPRRHLIVRRRSQYLACCLASLLPAMAQAGVLEQLIWSALQENPAIQAQQARERGAQASVVSANWQYYPTPAIAIESASASSSGGAEQGDSTVAIFSLQQPLWTGGRLTAGVKKAEAGVSVSQAELEDVRQQLAVRVVQSYGEWLAAHLKLLAYEQSMVTHVRLHDQVKRRIDQGVSADSDLTLAVSRLQSVAADLSVARAQQDIALARLGQLLGRRVANDELNAALAEPRQVSAGPQDLLDLAQAINPSLRRARAQAVVQETVIDERRADLLPEVFLRAEWKNGNETFRDTDPEARLLVGLNYRLGAGLSNRSNIETARSLHQAALAEVEVQTRVISEQVLADYLLAASSDTRLEALNSSLEAAIMVAESYDRQFLAGRKSWLDVMNAARELTQTQVQLADISAARVIATWRLAINSEGLAAVTGTMQ
jgi:outer membrane protein, adhesin transport system